MYALVISTNRKNKEQKIEDQEKKNQETNTTKQNKTRSKKVIKHKKSQKEESLEVLRSPDDGHYRPKHVVF